MTVTREYNSAANNISVVSIFGILLIVLKLTGLLDCSWVWVLMPYWLSGAIAIIFIVAGLVVRAVKKKKEG